MEVPLQGLAALYSSGEYGVCKCWVEHSVQGCYYEGDEQPNLHGIAALLLLPAPFFSFRSRIVPSLSTSIV
ncbi:hypothetical protein SLEP1_g10152 [Rubroshorea leprosula]|uniref:Uncharacterized protein n=1 Tax=Rubroshorea leprosula TaxID=152421 RepID=A0AAV5ID40_9ROSI|nr:hypothetical protein SLEP1_g10152 [Rubroshorea leprosula]